MASARPEYFCRSKHHESSTHGCRQGFHPGCFFRDCVWSYTEYNRQIFDGRGGYEFFPEDGNYVYTFAQWFARMCVYDDYEGWQNKQFYGRGEFALTFGDYKVRITVPSDHIVGATGWLQNPREVLSSEQIERFERAQKTFDKPV